MSNDSLENIQFAPCAGSLASRRMDTMLLSGGYRSLPEMNPYAGSSPSVNRKHGIPMAIGVFACGYAQRLECSSITKPYCGLCSNIACWKKCGVRGNTINMASIFWSIRTFYSENSKHIGRIRNGWQISLSSRPGKGFCTYRSSRICAMVSLWPSKQLIATTTTWSCKHFAWRKKRPLMD